MYIYIVFCQHPESDAYWIEDVYESEYLANLKKNELYEKNTDGSLQVDVEKREVKSKL